jgi:hypothetical protein
VHHWVLPMAGEELWIEGVCKKCGARKMFKTEVESRDIKEMYLLCMPRDRYWIG